MHWHARNGHISTSALKSDFNVVDIIRTGYYIHGSDLTKLIFAVLDVSLTMGLTRCYKTEVFFYIFKNNLSHIVAMGQIKIYEDPMSFSKI